MDFFRRLVSQGRRRYKDDEFDLDLTYVVEKIIAMGFPAAKIEGTYRNRIDDVKRFLDKHHKSHYRVYNLCSERSYDPRKFDNRVSCYPFDDHNPPSIELMKRFCEDVDKWLAQHSQNIAVVHCKAGKGRTGTMICAYLLHKRNQIKEDFSDARKVLDFYASKRTTDNLGVTIPSQRRYVAYFDLLQRNKHWNYRDTTVKLRSIVFNGKPLVGGSLVLKIYNQGKSKVFQAIIHPSSWRSGSICSDDSGKSMGKIYSESKNRLNIDLTNCPAVQGDVKIKVSTAVINPRLGYSETLFQLWFNTFFLDLLDESFLVYPHNSSGSNTNGTVNNNKHKNILQASDCKRSTKANSPKQHVVPRFTTAPLDENDEELINNKANVVSTAENNNYPATRDYDKNCYKSDVKGCNETSRSYDVFQSTQSNKIELDSSSSPIVNSFKCDRSYTQSATSSTDTAISSNSAISTCYSAYDKSFKSNSGITKAKQQTFDANDECLSNCSTSSVDMDSNVGQRPSIVASAARRLRTESFMPRIGAGGVASKCSRFRSKTFGRPESESQIDTGCNTRHLCFHKFMLDKGGKDREHKNLPKDFHVDLLYETAPFAKAKNISVATRTSASSPNVLHDSNDENQSSGERYSETTDADANEWADLVS